MATTAEPWGTAPLTTEGLARQGRPLSLSDFNRDAAGRYWRTIRGEKTYYPREWFDADGTFTGTGTQPGDRAGQDDSGFFHTGTKWDWNSGEWRNPVNWANVIGLAAAGGVGAGIALPAVGALAGGGGAGAGGATTAASAAPTVAATGGGMGTVGSILRGMGGAGPYSWIPQVAGMGLNLYGQNANRSANEDALNQQLASTQYSTDAQAKSAAASLEFLKQQAAYDQTAAEANRSGNYDQWAARQEMLGNVGQMLGLPARRIPAYVPLPTANYNTGTPPPTGTTTTTPGPTGTGTPTAAPGGMPNIQGGDIAAQVRDYFASRGVTPNESTPQYWAQKWNEFGARDPQYFNMRLSQADEFGGGAGAPTSAAASPARRYQPMTDPLAAVQHYFADPVSDAGTLRAPTVRSLYGGNVGSYLG